MIKIMTGFKGIFPATITPMYEDFSIDFDTFKKYIIWLKDQGISGFAINVDTGEGPSLSSEERMKLLTTAKEISGADFRSALCKRSINMAATT